jgi:hypothetical protein
MYVRGVLLQPRGVLLQLHYLGGTPRHAHNFKRHRLGVSFTHTWNNRHQEEEEEEEEEDFSTDFVSEQRWKQG